MNKCVVLMPASQYRIKRLYEYVGGIEGVDSKVFKGAIIGCNLPLAECYKNRTNKYTYRGILLACSDKEYLEYYKWNIKHNKGLAWTEVKNKAASSFNVDYDFLETSRCVTECGGGRFGPASFGYAWNVLKNTSSVNARMTYISWIQSQNKTSSNIFIAGLLQIRETEL